MKYNNHLNYKKRKRFLLKVKLVIVALILALLVGAGWFFKDVILSQPDNTKTKTDSTKTYYVPKINIFRTPYFQFQADDGWVEVPDASTSKKFVYSFITKSLVQHELTIYVEDIPANLTATRVMKVSLNDEKNGVIPGEVSKSCEKFAPPEQVAKVSEVTIDKVTFNCDVLTPNYRVIAGLPGENGTVLDLIRPDGTKIGYTFVYQNLKADSEASQFTEILQSFQTR